MESLADPLPPGDLELFKEGPETMLVLRHADPCQVRPAGYASAFPLSFYKKSLRLHSGSCVLLRAGRAHRGALGQRQLDLAARPRGGHHRLQEPRRPAFVFQQVERAEIQLQELGAGRADRRRRS
jgi:hypothetical protein